MTTKPYSVLTAPDHASWLATRRKGIGSSEAGMVAGMSKYGGPLTVYAEKVGDAQPKEQSDAMTAGILLEAIVAARYQRARPEAHLSELPRYATLQSNARPWQLATIDRWAWDEGPDTEPYVVEIKTTNERFRRGWQEEGIPKHYLAQVQHQLAVTGAKRATVPALYVPDAAYPIVNALAARESLGEDIYPILLEVADDWALDLFEIQRDEELIASITEAEARLWALIQDRKPPTAGEFDDLSSLAARVYPKELTGTSVEIPTVLLANYYQAKDALAAAERDFKRLDGELRYAIGSAETATCQGSPVFSFKTQTRTSPPKLEATTATFRVLREKKRIDVSAFTF